LGVCPPLDARACFLGTIMESAQMSRLRRSPTYTNLAQFKTLPTIEEEHDDPLVTLINVEIDRYNALIARATDNADDVNLKVLTILRDSLRKTRNEAIFATLMVESKSVDRPIFEPHWNPDYMG
jgi:hypothetical protein